MNELAEDTKVENLALPYHFEANSVEGKVTAVIAPLETDEEYFKGCNPYQYWVGQLNLWDHIVGSTTIRELKEDISSFKPRNSYNQN
jgi:hypothetical protein